MLLVTLKKQFALHNIFYIIYRGGIMISWLRQNVLTPFLRPIRKQYNYKIKYRRFKYDGVLDIDWESMKEDRITIVKNLCKYTDCKRYLEIGCAMDKLFAVVNAPVKIGVDPESGGTERKTSDEFFFDIAKKDGYEKFDVIFIDGLHTYEQVRKDILNSMKWLNVGGFIAIHDLIPLNWKAAHPTRIDGSSWNGDVWKVGFELNKTEKIDFKIFKNDNGVGVFKLQSKGAALYDFQDEIKDKQFEYFYNNYDSLPVICFEEGLDWIKNSMTA
jgi:hypothetical protein